MSRSRSTNQPLLRWLPGLAGCVGIAALSSQFATGAHAADKLAPPPAAAAPQTPATPMSDAEWKKNSGSGAVPERYQIVKGDTLSGISKRFFGDGRAWPKLYEWNKDTISNPNLIYPNKWVVFVPGTGSTLPKIADSGEMPKDPGMPSADGSPGMKTTSSGNEEEAAPADKITSGAAKNRSEEWKLLPKQAWEVTPASLPANTDSLGFDRDNKLHFSKARGFELDAIAATERVTTLGQIIGGRSGAQYLSLGDTVYIRADEDIQLGETYAVTQEPSILKSRKSDRQGYSYLILGKVKIIGVRDDLFVGTIVAGKDFISRGNELIINPAKVPPMTPIAAPTATEGVVMMDKNFSTFFTAQHKLIFVDRGSSDGVKNGMIFRAYEHYDLSNEKKITSSDFIIDADAMVVQTSEHFSVATIINSIVPVTENSTAVLLTDVSDLTSNKGFRAGSGGDKKGNDELDELDKLDNSSGLGKDEQKELQQLEKWKGNPNQPGAPDANGAGTPGGAPPPPPDEVASPPPPPPPPPPPSDSKPDELAPPPPETSAPPAPPSENLAPPPPPPPPADSDLKAAGKGTPQSSKKSVSPAPSEPAPPAPPPAPGGGGAQAPTDESKALDQLLNQ